MQVQRKLPDAGRSLVAGVTTDPQQIVAAQRLRFGVFSAEYGADLGSNSEGIDADRFDPHCDHIIVANQDTGEIVATTRVLLGTVAATTGGFYSENEFDLARLKANTGVFAELGRTCVHPDYRQSLALSLLWATVSQHLLANSVNYLIGCASISMLDGGRKAWLITRQLQEAHLTPERFRVTPLRALPHLASKTASQTAVDVPPLIRAYMRLGAQVCGAPCWDPSFRCADLLVLLDVARLAGRYSRKYMHRG